MTKVLLFVLVCFATNVFGQTNDSKLNGIIVDNKKSLASDSSLKVVYTDTTTNTQKPAYFLNDKFVNQTLLTTLDPILIESVDVVKDDIQIDNIRYYGQIHIKTKDTYNPKIISLTALKDKYTNLKGKSTIFMINGSIVNNNYDTYLVDENYLLTLTVDKVKNTKENIDVGLIKLLTKSEENIKKSKEIKIRGANLTLGR